MRLAFVYPAGAHANAQYRLHMPLNALRARGHEVVWCEPSAKALPIGPLESCDLVHVYRSAETRLLRAVERLKSAGVTFTWDNDDDVAALAGRMGSDPRLHGLVWQRELASQLRAAKLATLVTTTSASLADRFYGAGARRVEIVENYVPPEFGRQTRAVHTGLVLGWMAALEHEADAHALGLRSILLKLLEDHADLRVVTVGLDLRLDHERYQWSQPVQFAQLGRTISAFDIGIAPLIDDAFNRARSNVKIKEYAIAGVPWLASPVGEYASLGPKQGGRLVENDDWERALKRLISRRHERFALAIRGKLWGRRQTIELNAGRWERVFEHAIAQTARQGP